MVGGRRTTGVTYWRRGLLQVEGNAWLRYIHTWIETCLWRWWKIIMSGERLSTFVFVRACSKKGFHCCSRNRRGYQWKTQRWSHIGPTGRCCYFNNDPISSTFSNSNARDVHHEALRIRVSYFHYVCHPLLKFLGPVLNNASWTSLGSWQVASAGILQSQLDLWQRQSGCFPSDVFYSKLSWT